MPGAEQSEIQKLESEGYILESRLNHSELIPFIAQYLFRKNYLTRSYLFINLLFLVLLLWKWIVTGLLPTVTFWETVKFVLLGTMGTALLIAPHELLHGIAYRFCGARHVTYKANWKKLYFMAVADQFVTHKRQFYFIALTPFVGISITLLVLSVFVTPGYQLACLSALFLHTTMCAGDFGLMSYFVMNSDREIVTFDDVAEETSYFYSRPKG